MKISQGKAAWIVLLFSILFLWVGNRYASAHALHITISGYESEMNDQLFAKVTRIDSVTPSQTDSSTNVVKFTCIITSGDKKGTSVYATQYAYKNNAAMPPQVSPNDKVVLGKLSDGSSTEYTFENYDRIEQVFWLSLVFVGLIVVFGGKRGLKTVLSLALTCFAIFFVFVPCIMAGFNIFASTVVICIYIIAVSYILTGGINQKSLSAAIGCSGGVAFSGAVYIVMERIMKLTGYYNDQTSLLEQTFTQCPLDLKAIVFAMVTIGALGATMDVAMSIASSLEEIQKSKSNMRKIEIIQSGFNIGKDIMGTMTNTLILAYIGSSLIMVLIYAASNYPILQLLNKEEIIVEILQSLIGSLGMLFTIPFTTVISAWLIRKSVGQRPEEAKTFPHVSQSQQKKNLRIHTFNDEGR
ncbi:YibE/F family protein [Caproicibacter fermentans]|uniref:YibE/F family protein n=1 Tax=Caproicibacter fermentans TaxID=2576756 RepID=A0A7G8TA49_9FIRM|nr:YibE/F family protein [Caproicibacter fermentans]QNK40490.1 YibE/F family protein [Caproicibacter fermentans]